MVTRPTRYCLGGGIICNYVTSSNHTVQLLVERYPPIPAVTPVVAPVVKPVVKPVVAPVLEPHSIISGSQFNYFTQIDSTRFTDYIQGRSNMKIVINWESLQYNCWVQFIYH